ncbi:hypothetical protein [Neisseria sicca]|uniref:hypothetical protein n=1 Tax=Neisseria sicca TaxID=490 RepID=UPI00131C8652|nr:hypothetical protein [Neisseria sicca]
MSASLCGWVSDDVWGRLKRAFFVWGRLKKGEGFQTTFVMGWCFRLLTALRVAPYLRRISVGTAMRGKTLLRRGFKVV